MTNEGKALQAARDYLAAQTLRHWRTRKITISSPVAVPWGRAGRATSGPHLRLGRHMGEAPVVAVKGFREGVVTQLREQVYDQPGTSHRRIALSGGPGSGKTTAMKLLLIDVLRHRAADEPVPVWLTCSEWNPQTTPLLAWVATTMARDYPGLTGSAPGPRGAAEELIQQGCVALFLDGLDEMPLAARAKALELIDREAPRMRVVLSSRQAELGSAFRALHEETGSYYFWDVIRILPVDVPDAEAFLLAGQSGERRRTWQHFVDHLREHPRSVAFRTFAGPPALSLARENYADAGTDPADLLDERAHPTPDAILQHLLSQRLAVAGPDDRPNRVLRPVWVERPPGPIRALLSRATGLWRSIASEYRVLASRWATRADLRELRGLGFALLSVFVVVPGILLGIVLGILVGIAAGPVVGIVVAIGFALAVALLAGIAFWAIIVKEIFSGPRTDHS